MTTTSDRRDGEDGGARRRHTSRLERWETATFWPFVGLSVVFLGCYSTAILVPAAAVAPRIVCLAILAAIWLVFIADFIVRLVLVGRGRRLRVIRKNPIEFVAVLVPVTRPFLLLRRLRRVPGFRGRSGNAFRSRLVAHAVLAATLFIYVVALSVYALERGAPHATILSFGDAVWWSFVTIATVGYGDLAPVTVPGRILAIVLMAGGAGILAVASATLVSYLSERIAAAQRERDNAPEGDDPRA
ncbi:MAG: ion channel [Galbitalea sp.]